jgi:glycosyltransferase involved in cell wall biosynthesis
MVIAEGMAAGRAVVAARAGGASELFDDGVDAVAHTPGDARDLAERLGELMENAALRRRLGAAARATACRRFAASRMAAEFREVYLG